MEILKSSEESVDENKSDGNEPLSTSVKSFFKLFNDEQQTVNTKSKKVCCLCNKTISCPNRNVSNMTSHLKRHHPLKFRELELKRNLSQSQSVDEASITADNLSSTR